MSFYGDGKHNEDMEHNEDTKPSFEVVLRFECIDGKNPLEVAKKIAKWLEEGSGEMVYEVTNEISGEKFTVDLSEDDENAVLPE